MADCLVIGGNGFLGSHLVDALVERGHRVSAFDRFSSEPLYTAKGVTRLVGDFRNRAELSDALAGQQNVFHFLSSTTPATSEDDPILDVHTNLADSVALLELAVGAGIRRVFFASSGGTIYGDQPAERITEDALPLPISPYAIGKLAIEGYLRYFQRKHGLESVSFRISNPYGPRQHPNKKQGVIPIFLQRIAEGLPITVLGDGTMTRDFVYVEDVARMVADTVEGTPAHPVYNIGSGHGATVNDVLALAREITGREISVRYAPRPVTFVDRSVLDVGRYAAEFGRGASVSLREGMELTWRDTLEQLA